MTYNIRIIADESVREYLKITEDAFNELTSLYTGLLNDGIINTLVFVDMAE